MRDIFGNYVIFFMWLWQFPQNIAAQFYLVRSFYKVKTPYTHYRRKGWSYGGGAVTLGEYVFTDKNVSEDTLRHEYGHKIQSRILGPLYLFVIGIPSIVHAWLHRKVCGNKPYRHFYTEAWADKLSAKRYGKGWLWR